MANEEQMQGNEEVADQSQSAEPKRVLTAEEIAQQVEAGSYDAYREAQYHPEAWREMTDEEIMNTKVSFKDGCFGSAVLLYALPLLLIVALLLYLLVSSVMGA